MALPKLLAPLTILALLQLSVSFAFCQPIPRHISLAVKDQPLTRILDTLEAMTGYTHFGETIRLRQARNVTINVKDATLKQVLDICFRNQPLLAYDLVDSSISVRTKEWKDSIIKGRIVNEKNEPVPGATITLKGGSQSSISNENGEFSIRLRSYEAGLVISSINYETKELKVSLRIDSFLVQMKQKIASLSDVMVLHTGYEVIPKERATGSFGKVDNDLLNRRVSTNILDRLDGVAGSVLFNKNNVFGTNQSSITIRGRSTIFANPEPLIVVDNFPYSGNIFNINPDDVESVTILKDAAAASIWGAFSGNGVIVVTTKKGKLNQAPRFEFNTSFTVGRKPDVYGLPSMPVGDYITIEDSLWDIQGISYAPTRSAISPVAEILIAKNSSQLSAASADSQINVFRGQDTRRDLSRYFYRNSLNRQYSLNLNGGSASNQYYLSAGYDKNLSGMTRNDYQRVTIDGNNTYFLFPRKLDISTGFAFTSSKIDNNNPGLIQTIYPYLKLADANGNALAVPYVYRQGYVDTAGGGQLLDWHYRPLDELRNADNVTKLNDYRINLRIHYGILRGLDAFAYYQYGKGVSDEQNFQSQQTFYTRNLINSFTQLGSGMPVYGVPLGGILDEIDSSYEANNVRGQLNFDHVFSSGRLSTIAGIELMDIEGRFRTTRLYGYDNDLRSGQGVNYNTMYPQYNPNYGSPLPIPYLDHNATSSDHYLSYYFNGSYTWKDKYIFSASGRKDESNIFGVNANHKGVPLWSAGVAWEISRESFYHADQWLPYLKLRITDGFNGNVDKSVSAYTTAVINSAFSSNGIISASIVNPANPNLQWEKIHIINTAVEFGTKNGHIDGSLEYYVKIGEDLIAPSPLDPTSGNTQYIGNTGAIITHGLDVTLRTKSVIGQMGWNTTFLLSYTMDRVTNYSLTQSDIGSYFNIGQINPLVGRPLYSVYAFKWMGLDPTNGDPLGILNGKTSHDWRAITNSPDLSDLVYMGPANPTVFGSLRNTFSYKQFSFSFNIVYKFGYYFRRNSINYSDLFDGVSAGHPDFDKRWKMQGDETRTNVPSLTFTSSDLPDRDIFYANSQVLVEKGDHIRLQDIQFSYDLPKRSFAKIPVQGIRVYLYANNIGIIWRANHEGIDPDYLNTNIPNPQTRTLAAGLKMDF